MNKQIKNFILLFGSNTSCKTKSKSKLSKIDMLEYKIKE